MIRKASIEDIESITAIYNQAIASKFQTAYTEPMEPGDLTRWFHEHNEQYPLMVYVANDAVVGWLSISPYREGRKALKQTVEISYYLDKKHVRQGIGFQMLQHGLAECARLNYKTVLAIILNKNIPSIKLVEKLDFEKWGYLPGIADFDGVVCSHLYYGIKL